MADQESNGMGTGLIIGILVILMVLVLAVFGRGFVGSGNQVPQTQEGTDISVPDEIDVNINKPE